MCDPLWHSQRWQLGLSRELEEDSREGSSISVRLKSLLFTLIQADIVKKTSSIEFDDYCFNETRWRCRNWKGTTLGDHIS